MHEVYKYISEFLGLSIHILRYLKLSIFSIASLSHSASHPSNSSERLKAILEA